MTAHGSATRDTPLGRWVVEIHSVNRKGLDIDLLLPRGLLCYEGELRRAIAGSVSRGQLQVRVALNGVDVAQQTLESYRALLRPMQRAWETLATELGYDPKREVPLQFLVEQVRLHAPSQEGIVPSAQHREQLLQVVQEALQRCLQGKEQEGELLWQDMQQRLHALQESCHAMRPMCERQQSALRDRLLKRLQEFLSLGAEGDDRLLREVVSYADKLDITEELVRFEAHLVQFRTMHLGRTLEFLTQEMLRELHTICAKSFDSELSHLAVQMKSEVERIREQVQNIE